MTALTLKIVKEDQKDIEIFLNDQDEIYIGEIGDLEESPCLFFTTISLEDWKEVKRFIDMQFRLTKS